MMYNLYQIAEITHVLFTGKKNYDIRHFMHDSRGVYSAADSLFIALKSNRNNGHQYIPELIERGVKSFLIAKGDFDYTGYNNTDISFLVSEDPLKTLQTLASYHRQRFSIPVIGITGSNGKTVVKEWLYQMLKDRFSICRSPKSYNSQIGVPLSVLNLNHTHQLAIFEAGISQPGEMDRLASIIRPAIGIFTSIGSAHDEGFVSRKEKISEKLKLLTGSDQLIISGLEKAEVPADLHQKSVFVSEYPDADLRLRTDKRVLYLENTGKETAFDIPFSDKASFNNAATCAAVLMYLGYTEKEIAEKLSHLQPVALRLELKAGIKHSLIINDYYNSDLDSLKIALDYLQQQSKRLKKIVIVSDIEQSGINTSGLYRNLAGLFAMYQIDGVVGIGKEISANKPLFKVGSLFFEDTQQFINHFKFIDYQFADAGILLKGARSFGFEHISKLLQQKSHDTVFEINLNKLTDNVNYYRSLISPGVQIMGMVKAMGYGSGSAEVAHTLQHIGVNYLAVAYVDEGVELREARITLPVMVMNPEQDGFEDIIQYNLEPEIYHFHVLKAFVNKLDALGITEPYPVHIKIDTGMHRLGFEEQETDRLISELKGCPQVKVKSVFSHLAASDNPDLDAFTEQQIRIFENVCSKIEEALAYPVIKHICNSGGITRFKQAHYNMVRLGIGMYGVGVHPAEQSKLQHVGTLKTRISQIKVVPKGETVGYNRNARLEKETRIATIPIGYADGFSRMLGNGKHGVYINGRFCKTVGNICMDMCMVDVSDVHCSEGSEVIIFENIEQIGLMAEAMNTISYEVLTNVSGRVKRVYMKE